MMLVFALSLSLHWPSTAVMAAGQFDDTISTIRFLHNGSGCREGNPRLGPYPSTRRLLTDKAEGVAIIAGVHIALETLAQRYHARGLRRLSRVINYASGGFGEYTATRNRMLCGG